MNNLSFKRSIALLLALAGLLCCACSKQQPEEDLRLEDVVISDAQEQAAEEDQPQQGSALPCAVDGNVSYSSSIYLLMLQESFQNLSLSTNLELSQLLDTSLKLSDGSVCSGADYIASEAEENFRQHYVTERLCRQAGLDIPQSAYYSMCLFYATQAYQSDPDYYDYFNIGTADLLEYYMSKYRYNDLFFALYGQGGDREIEQGRLEELMLHGAYRIQYIMLPLVDGAGSALSQEEITQRQQLCKDYLSRFEGGEDFTQLVFESYRYLDEAVEQTEDSNYDYYGSVTDGFTPEIRQAVQGLADGQAALVESQQYCALVLKLPVNGDQGEKWRNAALQLAYADREGREYDSYMAEQFAAIEPEYNQGVKALLTPENYAALLAEYTAG